MDNSTYWILVVDTDKYAGNFERKMCAYMTGRYGDCRVGEDKAKLFYDEEKDIFDPDDDGYGYITSIPDEHGCMRPVAAWGPPTYMSVAIFFEIEPTNEMIKLMKRRANKYVKTYGASKHVKEKLTIEGFKLLKRTITIEELWKSTYIKL